LSNSLLETAPAATDAYDIAYFKRHVDDDPTEAIPGRDFLGSCPVPVRAKFVAVLIAVAAAPPSVFLVAVSGRPCTTR